MKYIGVDIGGTNIACGIVDEKGTILVKESVKTEAEQGYKSIINNIAGLVKDISEDLGSDTVGGIGVGCPGCCNRATGIVEVSNNLNWHNVELEKDLSALTGHKVKIGNDADAAAFGEYVAGAAKGANSAIVITLGTGVGSGVIIDGKLLHGVNYAGGEIGHMVIHKGGWLCTCGRRGCFEAYSSATGLIRMTKEAMERDPSSAMTGITEELGKISARTAFNAARLGDKAGAEVVEMYIRYLACGITNVINIFQPDIVCIGGGVCNEGDYLLVPLKEQVRAGVFSKNSAVNTDIAICKLGNDAGIIGAAQFAAV